MRGRTLIALLAGIAPVIAGPAFVAAAGATVVRDPVATASSPPTKVTVTGPASVAGGGTYVAAIASDGDLPLTFAFGKSPVPPAWLSINLVTGAVSGPVPKAGITDFSYVVVATNKGGFATSAKESVAVLTPPTAVMVTGPSSVVEETAYAATAVADGSPPPTFALAGSPVPPVWLSIDSSTGAVSGPVPTGVTAFSYAVVATNSEGSATSPTVTVTAATPPTNVIVNGASHVTQGAVYYATTTADGSAPLFFELLAFPRPLPWLSIDPTTGEVRGTAPIGVTEFAYAVHATNAEGAARSAPVLVAVDQPDVRVAMSHLGSFHTFDRALYQVVVSNASFVSVDRGVTIVDVLPAGLSYLGSVGAEWTCTALGQRVTCAFHGGILGVRRHRTTTFALIVQVLAAGGVLDNTVRVTPSDATPADNVATDRLVVVSTQRPRILARVGLVPNRADGLQTSLSTGYTATLYWASYDQPVRVEATVESAEPPSDAVRTPDGNIFVPGLRGPWQCPRTTWPVTPASSGFTISEAVILGGPFVPIVRGQPVAQHASLCSTTRFLISLAVTATDGTVSLYDSVNTLRPGVVGPSVEVVTPFREQGIALDTAGPLCAMPPCM